MKLSVLDQSPISEGFTAADALHNTIELAKLTDRLGYTRFWVAEHHSMASLASPAPEILIARLGVETQRIRVGSGGVMLPHYSPMKVAEVFAMLNGMYPGRVDLGLGRAPGGGPLETFALRRERTERAMPDDFGQQLMELCSFLDRDFPSDHPFARIQLSSHMPGGGAVWLLGSSMWSASAAAQLGLPYAFAHFFSGDNTRAAITHYQSHFEPSKYHSKPQSMAAIGVICAETEEEAQRLASGVRLLRRRLQVGDLQPIASPETALRELGVRSEPSGRERSEWPAHIIGTPPQVREALDRMATELKLDELMIVTITHDPKARMRSYELLAEAYGLQPHRTSSQLDHFA